MDLKRLGQMVFFMGVVVASFVARYALRQSRISSAAAQASARQAVPERVEQVPVREEPKQEPKETRQEQPKKPVVKIIERRPAAQFGAPRAASAMEATKLGSSVIGQRVTWTGKWIHSQSGGSGSPGEHIFETQGPGGGFTFDFPFVAKDSKPLERPAKGQNIKEHFDRRWGASHIVTVTGTIDRLEKLIFIGRGTREQVPVLKDIVIQQ